jgi:hypothetical protein
MKFGTVSFDKKIYNLDYMNAEDIAKLEENVGSAIDDNFIIGEKIIKDNL